MIFQLSEEDILKVCAQCSNYNDNNCTKESKPVADVRRCLEWDKYYREKCIRKR